MKHTKLTYKTFNNNTVKILPRPKLTYTYNILMNQVDREDQRQAIYLIY